MSIKRYGAKGKELNDHDIKLPAFPENVAYQESVLRDYATAAVLADRQRAFEAQQDSELLEAATHQGNGNKAQRRIIALMSGRCAAPISENQWKVVAEKLQAENDELKARLEAHRMSTYPDQPAGGQAQQDIEALLKDPAVVHQNMLLGKIAKIDMLTCAHTHGAEMVQRWREFEAQQDADKLDARPVAWRKKGTVNYFCWDKQWADESYEPLYTAPVASQPDPAMAGDEWTLAEAVRKDLDRQSCPDAYMRIAVESVIKHSKRVQPASGEDAARINWIDTVGGTDITCFSSFEWKVTSGDLCGTGNSLRTAIDAAMQQGGQS